jgi:ribosome-associated protein
LSTLHDTRDEDHQPAARLNKSRQKREIQALLDLGKKLAAMDEDALHKMGLPAEILRALLDCRTMKRGALKRQHKLIGKLLRQINTESLETTISALERKKAEQDKTFHRTGLWRDRLLSSDPLAMTRFMAEYPHANAPQIRQLIRNASREIAANSPPRASRLLFRLLREIIS